MLTQAPMTTLLPVRDLARARDFYQGKLGLTPRAMQANGEYQFRCGNGAILALFPKPEGTKAEHTAASFQVDDIVAEIRDLEAQGVTFHDYDLPGLKTLEHVCIFAYEFAAWFSDTEGNLLCLRQNIERKR